MAPWKKLSLSSVRGKLGALRKAWLRPLGNVSGMPPDLPESDLESIALEHCGRPYQKAGHEHLSGWKRLGAFRVFLDCASPPWTVIYKNSIYDNEEIPALEGLSVLPGPPEFLVYSLADTALGQYLPEVYLLRRREDGRHYQYLLEDIDRNYVGISGSNDIITVCGKLPELYRHMEESMSDDDKKELLHFDKEFSLRILDYSEENLGRFATETRADDVNIILTAWESLSATYRECMNSTYDRSTFHPIHGDLNLTNIRLHKMDPNQITFLDWEWAGIGSWWFDMVALLKSAPQDIEEQGLRTFFSASDLDFGTEQRQSYQWAKLQRGLFDASFFAKQVLDIAEQKPTKIRMESHMRAALDRAVMALTQLQGERDK